MYTANSNSNQDSSVHLVPNDLRSEELVHQLLDALASLDSANQTLGDKVSDRIRMEQTKLNSIADRLSRCQSQIRALTGFTKTLKKF